MKKYIIPALLLMATLAEAQSSRPPLNFRTAFTFSPLHLLGPDFTFLPGVEYRIRPGTTLQGELGWIFASAYVGSNGSSEATTKANGFMFRPSVKFYLNERKTFYVQPQLFYKMVTHHLSDWVDKNVVNGVGSYQEYEAFRYRRSIFGFNAIAGALVPLSRRNNSFFDFYIGFGARSKDGWIVDQPNSHYDGQGSFGRLENVDHGTYPSIPGGARLVFVID